MLSAQCLIHTEIIDIQSFDICEDIIVDVLRKDAECIALHDLITVFRYKNRPLVILYNGQKLFVGIFFCTVFEQIGTISFSSARLMFIAVTLLKMIFCYYITSVRQRKIFLSDTL